MAAAITPASTWPPAMGQPSPVATGGRSSTKGHCIGSAGLRVDADQHCPIDTLGVFAPGLRGQGLGREITRLVLTRASGVLGAHRVELEVLAGNSRAIGCYRACGLRQEGIRRHDFILMAVLQPEKRIRSLGHPPSGPDRA
jgi:RimJ/RimL family protein N-acetyltransferase